MAWKGRDQNPLQNFSDLLNSLNNSKLSQSNNALWQTIYGLITRMQGVKDTTVIKLKEVADQIFDIGNTIFNITANLKDATFWTKNNETLNFPSSLEVIAGTGITLDYSVANQVTVNSTGGGSGVLPMVNGDEPPQLMSNGAGDLIVISYDLPTEIP